MALPLSIVPSKLFSGSFFVQAHVTSLKYAPATDKTRDFFWPQQVEEDFFALLLLLRLIRLSGLGGPFKKSWTVLLLEIERRTAQTPVRAL